MSLRLVNVQWINIQSYYMVCRFYVVGKNFRIATEKIYNKPLPYLIVLFLVYTSVVVVHHLSGLVL